jgi:Sugar phosphate isomerases/epimerases
MAHQNVYFFELPLWDSFSFVDAKNIILNIGSSMYCYSVHLPKMHSVKGILANVDLINGVRLLKPRIAVLHPQNEPDFIQDCNQLSRILSSIGCQLCLEYILYDKRLQIVFESLPDSIGITLDFYHCAKAGFSVESTIRHYSSHIKHIHLNDYSVSGGMAKCPGEGSLPLDRCFDLLQEQVFHGAYMLECGFTDEKHFHGIMNYCKKFLIEM